MEGFGDRLRRLRKEQRITQSDLAKHIGVTRESISNYENDKRLQDVAERIVQLAELLGTTPNYLLLGTGDAHPLPMPAIRTRVGENGEYVLKKRKPIEIAEECREQSGITALELDVLNEARRLNISPQKLMLALEYFKKLELL